MHRYIWTFLLFKKEIVCTSAREKESDLIFDRAMTMMIMAVSGVPPLTTAVRMPSSWYAKEMVLAISAVFVRHICVESN